MKTRHSGEMDKQGKEHDLQNEMMGRKEQRHHASRMNEWKTRWLERKRTEKMNDNSRK